MHAINWITSPVQNSSSSDFVVFVCLGTEVWTKDPQLSRQALQPCLPPQFVDNLYCIFQGLKDEESEIPKCFKYRKFLKNERDYAYDNA